MKPTTHLVAGTTVAAEAGQWQGYREPYLRLTVAATAIDETPVQREVAIFQTTRGLTGLDRIGLQAEFYVHEGRYNRQLWHLHNVRLAGQHWLRRRPVPRTARQHRIAELTAEVEAQPRVICPVDGCTVPVLAGLARCYRHEDDDVRQRQHDRYAAAGRCLRPPWTKRAGLCGRLVTSGDACELHALLDEEAAPTAPALQVVR